MKKSYVLSLMLIFLTSFVFAGTIDLPQTGQTKCYDTAGLEIPCAGTGQDGEIQAGVAWPEPRFKDNGDGTMTDNLTGLMWTKNANLPGGYGIWQPALDYVAGMNAGTYSNFGYTDWRLPNVNELKSLTDFSRYTPVLPAGNPFTNVQTSYYWSSTTYAYDLDYAWFVDMSSGHVGGDDKSSGNFYVWLVRAGQSGSFENSVISLPQTGQKKCYDTAGLEIPCAGTGQDGEIQAGVAWPEPRFKDNGDGTMTDNLTGLMWTKNANLPNNIISWQPALDYVAGMNAGTYSNFGYTDWRLPNVNELGSLINANEADSATWLNAQGFTNVQDYYYWSSTTYAYFTNSAWKVSMNYGDVGYGNKSKYSFISYVWPVRGGQAGPLAQWIVSGTVTGDVQAGVTITLSGSSSGITTTDLSGNYSLKRLSNGSYTVTPSKSGYSFIPSNRQVTISGSNVTGVDFVASNACTYTISPTSQLFSAEGGTGNIEVSCPTECNWTATSNATWITITSRSSGSGNGTVAYSVSATTSTIQRTSTITIAGETFTVTQSGVTCSYTISPTSKSFSSSGGTGSVSVTTQSGCTWTATSNDSWITITSGSSETGNETVNYSLSANTATSQRTGTMIIAGYTFTVTQEGVVSSECSTWTDVIDKYNSYVDGQAGWTDVITCYSQYTSP